MILDKFSLESKKAVVIGASRGLGKRIVLALAQADVIVSSRSLTPLEEVAKEIKQVDRKSHAIECDVSNISEIEKLHELAIDGFSKVDILINAAGTTIRERSTEITEEDWEKVAGVNAIAPGYFLTEMTKSLFKNKEWTEKLLQGIPLARVGTPEDLDGTMIFLCSQASDYVTGEILFVDRGFMSGENL